MKIKIMPNKLINLKVNFCFYKQQDFGKGQNGFKEEFATWIK